LRQKSNKKNLGGKGREEEEFYFIFNGNKSKLLMAIQTKREE